MSLEGDLREFSLINVMQIICMENRRAGLFVRRRGEEAAIYFDAGDIVSATAGHLQGEEAVYQLLTWTDGTFRTSDQVTIPAKNVGKNWNHLLIEGMRRIDEERHVNRTGDESPRQLSKGEAERDNTTEQDLILLLSGLEQNMARLGERKFQKNPDLAVQLLIELTNKVAEFAEHVRNLNRSEIALNAAVKKTAAAYPAVANLEANGNRLVSLAAANGHARWTSIFGARQTKQGETCQGLVAILHHYFTIFEAAFLSPSVRDQWKETYRVFIGDLKMKLDRVQF